jgi:NAD+ synthase (glutamine-hydrolysing)
MAQMRLALAQINPTVGDLGGNAALVREWTGKAAAAGAHLVAFPEMMLTGYPVEDLALRPSFVEASRQALTKLATDLASDGLGDLPVVVGYLDRAPYGIETSRPLPQNCAAVLHHGEVMARYAKHHLPNYGVFDEFRIFAPGKDLTIVRIGGMDVAIAICEDLWQEGGPVALTRQAGAALLLVINGSPYEQDKDDVRYELVARRAAQAGCTLAYLNMVGAQDELVFDGDSLVVDPSGTVLARGPQFEQDLLLVDLDCQQNVTGPVDVALPVEGVVRVSISDTAPSPYAAAPASVTPRLDPVGEVYRAVQLGLHDYVRKNGFASVLLGVSGGIDSTLVATIAADALGGQNVVAISNPSRYSSQGSRDDAAELAENLGLDYRVIPIEPMVGAFLDPLKLTGVAQENVQARVRGLIWMGLGNQEGHLVLTNSNKSEVSVGYSTLYGDSVGGFAPLKDVPKTLVWELARWRNAEAQRRGEKPPIPLASITKAPSAELRPGQVDQDSLPPYDILDAILDRYVEKAQDGAELVEAGFDADVVAHVIGLVDGAEWKRRQFAPGPKISSLAFGRDRRMPITNRWREDC